MRTLEEIKAKRDELISHLSLGEWNLEDPSDRDKMEITKLSVAGWVLMWIIDENLESLGLWPGYDEAKEHIAELKANIPE